MKKPTMEELCRDINYWESVYEPENGDCWEQLEGCISTLKVEEQKIITNHYRKLVGWLYRDLEAEKKKKENKEVEHTDKQSAAKNSDGEWE